MRFFSSFSSFTPKKGEEDQERSIEREREIVDGGRSVGQSQGR
jgi:hypothetical protein